MLSTCTYIQTMLKWTPETHTETERDAHTDRERHTQRQRETHTQRQKQRENRQTEKQRGVYRVSFSLSEGEVTGKKRRVTLTDLSIEPESTAKKCSRFCPVQ